MTSWRLRSIWSEGVLNAVCGSIRSIALFVMIVATTVAVVLDDGRSLAKSQELRDDLRRAGANVIIVEPADGAPPEVLSAATCESLHGSNNFVSAGAIMGSEFERSIASPSQRFRVVSISSGAIRPIVGTDARLLENEVVISPALAETLGLRAGAVIGATAGSEGSRLVTVASVAELDGRFNEYGRALLVVDTPVGAAERCVIEASDEMRSLALDGLALSQFDSPPRTLSVRRLATGGDFARSPIDEYLQRPTRRLWVAGAIGCAVLWLIVLFSRRSDQGLYRSFGLSRAGSILMDTAHLLSILVPAAAVGAAVAIVGLGDRLDEPGVSRAAFRAFGLSTTSMIVCCGLVTVLASAGRVSSMLKER